MFFKKKKGGVPVPIEDIRRMSASGLSDKDIIKELKNQGYSYEEIERAMLQAVKAGVEEEPKEKQLERVEPIGYEERPSGGLEELYPGEASPELPFPEISLPEEGPEVIVEELVEGVVEEKWQKFDEMLKKMRDEFEKIKIEMRQLEEKIGEGREVPIKDETGVTEFSNRLEDLEARIGGLEKAFRQFLPSLTTNIESLSEMVHSMRRREV